jgi:hypothetical protein
LKALNLALAFGSAAERMSVSLEYLSFPISKENLTIAFIVGSCNLIYLYLDYLSLWFVFTLYNKCYVLTNILDIITNWVWSEKGWLAVMGVMDYAGYFKLV